MQQPPNRCIFFSLTPTRCSLFFLDPPCFYIVFFSSTMLSAFSMTPPSNRFIYFLPPSHRDVSFLDPRPSRFPLLSPCKNDGSMRLVNWTHSYSSNIRHYSFIVIIFIHYLYILLSSFIPRFHEGIWQCPTYICLNYKNMVCETSPEMDGIFFLELKHLDIHILLMQWTYIDR